MKKHDTDENGPADFLGMIWYCGVMSEVCMLNNEIEQILLSERNSKTGRLLERLEGIKASPIIIHEVKRFTELMVRDSISKVSELLDEYEKAD